MQGECLELDERVRNLIGRAEDEGKAIFMRNFSYTLSTPLVAFKSTSDILCMCLITNVVLYLYSELPEIS